VECTVTGRCPSQKRENLKKKRIVEKKRKDFFSHPRKGNPGRNFRRIHEGVQGAQQQRDGKRERRRGGSPQKKTKTPRIQERIKKNGPGVLGECQMVQQRVWGKQTPFKLFEVKKTVHARRGISNRELGK